MTSFADGGSSRTGNVNLTANVDPYSRAMVQASQQTNVLIRTLDSLESRLDGLARRTSRKLFAFTAADVAVFTPGIVSAASFEKQLGTLQAGAQITGSSFKTLKSGIENTFTSLPVSRSEVVQLTESLSDMGVTGARNINSLAVTFLKLSAASGETVQGLTPLVTLSRQMGTTSATQIANYANSLLTVSKNAGVSLTGVLSFASAIAPLARQAGIGEAAVLGISAAFSKAGADGYVAANSFNSIISDITSLTASGSPALAKYANLIGVTVSQFKSMDKTTAIEQIFDTIAKQGPAAINTLQQLGVADGVRAQSAITAVVQSGGLDSQIAAAQGSSSNQNNLNKGAQTAMGGLDDSVIKLKNGFTQIGTEIGTSFLGPLTKVVLLADKFVTIIASAIKPFTPLIAAIGVVAAGIGAVAASALGLAHIIAPLLLALTVLKSSPVKAFRDGRANAMTGASNASSERADAGTLRWWQKPGYAAGQATARPMTAQEEAAEGGGLGAVRASSRRLLGAPLRFVASSANGQRDYVNDAVKSDYDRKSATLSGIGDSATRMRARVGGLFSTYTDSTGGGTHRMADDPDEVKNATRAAAATDAQVASAEAAAKANLTEADTAVKSSLATESLAVQARAAAVALGRMELATLKSGAIGGAKAVASGAGSVLGALGGPATAALIGIPALLGLNSMFNSRSNASEQLSGVNPLESYNSALGIATTNLATFSDNLTAASKATGDSASSVTSFKQAALVTPTDVTQYSQSKSTDPSITALAAHSNHDVNSAIALGSTHGFTDPRQLAMFKQNLLGAGYTSQQVQSIMNGLVGSNGQMMDVSGGYAVLGQSVNQTENTGFHIPGTGRNASQTGGQITNAALLGIQQGQVTNLQTHSAQYSAQVALQQSTDFLAAQGSGAKGEAGQKAFASSLSYLTTQGSGDTNSLYAGLTKKGAGQSGRNDAEAAAFKALQGATTKEAQDEAVIKLLQSTKDGSKYLSSITSVGGTVDVSKFDSIINASKNAPSGTAAAVNADQSGLLGQFASKDKSIQAAITDQPQNDPAIQYTGMQSLLAQAQMVGKSYDGTVDALDKLQGAINNTTDPLYILAKSAKAYAMQQEQYAQPYLSRGAQLGQSISDLNQAATANAQTPTADTASDLATAQASYEQQKSSYNSFLISMYQQLQSYLTQSQRAQESYNLSVLRSERDFNIQMTDSAQDYQRQTAISQRDFNLQMTRQAQSAAESIYSPYQRVQAQYTVDAGTLLQNLTDQNNRIAAQAANVKKLLADGVSQETINTLQLADPNNAQQTASLVNSLMQDPALIKQINTAVGTRLTATTTLTQSSFDETFTNTVTDFNTQLSDAATSYQISYQRAVAAQTQSLGDMATDYNTMVKQSAQDLNTSMTELYDAFSNTFENTLTSMATQVDKWAPQAADAIQAALAPITLYGSELSSTFDGVLGSILSAAAAAANFNADYKNPVTGQQVPGTQAVAYATGGLVKGRGTGTSDSVMARVSAGEYVMPADKTAMYRSALDSMRDGTYNLQAFAAGGAVSRTTLRGMQAGSSPAMQMGGGTTHMTMSADYSTQFTGNITVVAQDPKQLMAALQKQKRISKLSRPTTSTAVMT